MKRTKVTDALLRTDFGADILVNGWVRSKRGSKGIFFIALNDGSTIKNIQIVVDLENFDEEMLKKIRFKELHAYISCENALTLSGMKGGWDPEYNADGSGRAYPVARVFSVGLNVKF